MESEREVGARPTSRGTTAAAPAGESSFHQAGLRGACEFDLGVLGVVPMAEIRISPTAVWALQRSVGNQAVASALSGPRAGPRRLQKQGNQVDQDAEQGGQEAEAQAGGSLVLQVGNGADISLAEGFLRALEAFEPMLEAGAGQKDRNQPDNIASEIVHGQEHARKTQVPPEAIQTNKLIMAAVEVYLTQAGRQKGGTSEFKTQYQALLTDYGRLESVMTKYAGTSLLDVHSDQDAAGAVQNAAGAGGNTTEELAKTFQALASKEPVAGAVIRLQKATSEFEKMPADVTTSLDTANNSIANFENATTTVNLATDGLHSEELKKGFAEAKQKFDDTRKFTGQVRDLMTGAGKEAVLDKTAEVAVDALKGEGLTAMGVAEFATLGGVALGKTAVDKLILEPITEGIRSALDNANAAVGVVDKAQQLAMQQEAAQAQQDADTVATVIAAKATIQSAHDTMTGAINLWVEKAIAFDSKKLDVRKAFKEVADAISTATKGTGKAGEGKALGEMLSFLDEAEQFVVQANACTDIANKELAAGPVQPGEAESAAQAAEEALKQWDGKSYWAAYEYPVKNIDGGTTTAYGAYEMSMRVNSVLRTTPDEQAGLGSATGGDKAANTVVPEAVKAIEWMKAKVLAVRTQLQSQVFGAGAPS